MPSPVLLASGPGSATTDNKDHQAFDIVAADPIEKILLTSQSSAKDAELIERLCKSHLTPNQTIPDAIAHLPFFGGAIGLVSYQYAEQSMGIERTHTLSCPSMVGIYRWAIVIDHSTKEHWLVADAKLSEPDWSLLKTKLLDICNSPGNQQERTLTITSEWTPSVNREQYAQIFAHAKRYIYAGDCYQVNLTRQFSASYRGDLSCGFTDLSAKLGESFSAYLELDEHTVVSFSPERFIQIRGNRVTTEPIKGTRQRSSDKEQDQMAARQLHQSEKDRAENVMIVDLMRNDLGKHCKTGTVETTTLFCVQSYANVHHLVSKVIGRLASDSLSAKLHLFLDSLPGGSITGAPKIRAMQILAELETHDRACYCGSLFYLSSNGNLDSNIMIRSLLFDTETQQVYCWGGGGIVADSDLDAELDESYYKVSHILKALEQ